MSPRSKKEYLEKIFLRYKKTKTTQQKTNILDEFCKVCDYHRKHAIRLLNTFNRFIKPKSRRRGKPSTYQQTSVLPPLERIWLDSGMPCSKRLIVIIPLWLVHFPGGLDLPVIKAIKKVSASTIDRLLKQSRRKYKRFNFCTTKPGTLLRHQIPIKTNQWQEFHPGFVEADTVAHCGVSTAGIYVNTLNLVDIATGWSEQRAVWGKGETNVLLQIQNIEHSLPFSLKGFDCDNGGEFLNHHLLRHFADPRRQPPVQFTRSRAYKKDDNAHIEQKNYTHVRQWLGYHRFDNPLLVDLLNDLYQNEWRLYFNFFIPSIKLIDKIRRRSKIIKKHDAPKTPFQRVIDADPFYVSHLSKRNLKEQFAQLNPFYLKKIIDKKIQKILKLAYTKISC